MKRYLVSLGQLRGILDGLFVDEISAKAIAQIGRRAGASNATRRRDITAVSVVLRWCVAQGWREDNYEILAAPVKEASTSQTKLASSP